MISRLARPVFLIPLVIVLVLVGLGAWWLAQAGSSTPVSKQDAGREYGSADAAATPGAPANGVWTYRARGDETVGAGPIDVDRDLPGQAQVVVRPAPDGFWRTLVLSEEHVEASRYRVAPAGQYLEERITTLKASGMGRDDRKVMVPPPLVFPRSMEPGDAWTERYRMDKVNVSTRSRVLRSETLAVGGRDVPVLLIDKRGTISGAIAGYRNDRLWYSPDLAMPVRWILSTRLDGFASLRADVDLRLQSTVPS